MLLVAQHLEICSIFSSLSNSLPLSEQLFRFSVEIAVFSRTCCSDFTALKFYSILNVIEY